LLITLLLFNRRHHAIAVGVNAWKATAEQEQQDVLLL
jgi:hypothetical protein